MAVLLMILCIFLLKKFKFTFPYYRSNIFIIKIKEGLISYLGKGMKMSIDDCIMFGSSHFLGSHFKGKLLLDNFRLSIKFDCFNTRIKNLFIKNNNNFGLSVYVGNHLDLRISKRVLYFLYEVFKIMFYPSASKYVSCHLFCPSFIKPIFIGC